MIYNKKFIIGLLIVVATCAVALTIFLTTRKETPSPADTSSQNSTSDAPFEIKNFSSYEDLDITTKAAIVSSIEHYIADAPHTNTPVGVIREGSYKKTDVGTISNITFLVDIASLKRSYKIDFGIDSSTEQQTLYTLCPASSELVYPPFKCKDDLSEE